MAYEDIDEETTPEYEDMAVYEIMEKSNSHKTPPNPPNRKSKSHKTPPNPPNRIGKTDPDYVIPMPREDATDSTPQTSSTEYQTLEQKEPVVGYRRQGDKNLIELERSQQQKPRHRRWIWRLAWRTAYLGTDPSSC